VADDDYGMTSVDAKAFKRARSCFGLGRYFYDVPAIWVDLDQNRHPAKRPVLSGGPTVSRMDSPASGMLGSMVVLPMA
jgi:hypothetical protein